MLCYIYYINVKLFWIFFVYLLHIYIRFKTINIWIEKINILYKISESTRFSGLVDTQVILTERNRVVPVNQLKLSPKKCVHVFGIRWTHFFSKHVLHLFLIQEQINSLELYIFLLLSTERHICMVFVWFLKNVTTYVSVLRDLYMTLLFLLIILLP